jgi:hypothetical protein
MTNEFVVAERQRAAAWKSRTPLLPDEARADAPYVRDGKDVGCHPYCLPPAYAAYNLLPEVREVALDYFARQAIAWHQPTPCGPTNHLLSSQVQCVNALMAMNDDPARIKATFASVFDVSEVLDIEPGRRVAFEYIGAQDYLGEVPDGDRCRGARTTSADAALRYRTSDGHVEIALVEWKYTEDYRGQELSLDPGRRRAQRYERAWHHAAAPVRTDVLPYEDLFVEPFYQLFRQQLLAWRVERAGELDAACVRVVHVSPHDNLALRTSLNRPSHLEAGAEVFGIWRAMVRASDRFVTLDSRVFADPGVTSADYNERYG